MRLHEIISEASISDYLTRGLTKDEARKARDLRLSPAGAKYAKDNKESFEDMAKWQEQDRQSSRRRRAADARFSQVRAQLDKLANGSGKLSPSTVVMIIADDDELFDAIATWTRNPDVFENDPAITNKLEGLLKRMKPRRIDAPLWRGEVSTRYFNHNRAFHSWTPAKDVAGHFSDGGRYGSRLRKLEKPFRGFSLEELVTARHRLRPGESHYSGLQAEWLVLDPKEGDDTTQEW